jgi:hypothetical protein
MDINEEIRSGQYCPYCNCRTEIVTAQDIYGDETSYSGMFYRCMVNRDHYVGTYRDGITSFGRIADRELRTLKMESHEALDSLWKSESDTRVFDTRSRAYKWLSKKMGLAEEHTHIGMFDAVQCREAIGHCVALAENPQSNVNMVNRRIKS